MDVQLTPDQKAFAQHAIEAGGLHHESEAVQEALALWEHRERTRAELLAGFDQAEASLACVEGRIITEQSMMDLAHDVKGRGRTLQIEKQNAHLMTHRVSLKSEQNPPQDEAD